MMELKIEELWYSTRQDDWLIAENCYWNQVSDANRNLEKSLEMLNPDDIKHMNVETFIFFSTTLTLSGNILPKIGLPPPAHS